MALEIKKNTARSRFEITLDGVIAFVEYVERGDEWVLTQTYVPPALRGRGLAGDLVRAVLDAARSAKKKVNPVCSYAASFLDQHPEYADLRKPPAEDSQR